ncbi:jerky protein homolog-like [Elysia marginata]|uniref:Jerky protein homolog-like n=1 Tax=Elysia marginata TaxID=1093978 RepID=A0AAV4HQD3_9GAST|nr:jerky protein homolog-like [Elysia marginata]
MVFLRNGGSSRPQVPILDSHHSHEVLEMLELAEEQQIHVLALPPHTTHVLQPLDRVVFKPMKTAYKKCCTEFLAGNPGQIINKVTWPRLLKETWTSTMLRELLQKAFAATGIFAVDRYRIPEDVFVPGESLQAAKRTPHIDAPTEPAAGTSMEPDAPTEPSAGTSMEPDAPTETAADTSMEPDTPTETAAGTSIEPDSPRETAAGTNMETDTPTEPAADRRDCHHFSSDNDQSFIPVKMAPYKNYGKDQLEKAVEAVKAGSLSIKKAAQQFSVPRATVFYKLNNRSPMEAAPRTILAPP